MGVSGIDSTDNVPIGDLVVIGIGVGGVGGDGDLWNADGGDDSGAASIEAAPSESIPG